MAYNVEEIGQRIQRDLIGSPPRRLPTLKELEDLIFRLNKISKKMYLREQTYLEGMRGTKWWDDLLAWEWRLAEYHDRVKEAENKEQVLWTVTAPLVLGERKHDEGIGHGPPDATTPFWLANALDMNEAQRWRFLNDFWEDTKEVGRDVVGAVKTTAMVAAGIGVLYLLMQGESE